MQRGPEAPGVRPVSQLGPQGASGSLTFFLRRQQWPSGLCQMVKAGGARGGQGEPLGTCPYPLPTSKAALPAPPKLGSKAPSQLCRFPPRVLPPQPLSLGSGPQLVFLTPHWELLTHPYPVS